MKTLYLVRHAKSSWENANLSDHDRPLNHRGERDAPRMGKRLRTRKPQPEMIVSSSAVRAKTTATILATEIGYPTSDISIDERLYGAEPKDVVSIIGELDDALACAMLVGHKLPKSRASWSNLNIPRNEHKKKGNRFMFREYRSESSSFPTAPTI